MTTEVTQAPAENGVSVQRQNYFRALSLAEQILSETAKLPTNFDVIVHPWTPDAPVLRFYFHMDVPGLRQFRDDQMLTETREDRADSVYIEATRDNVDGVRVVAWTLLTADGNAAVSA
ncbi:hypothetical protein [Streptomyces cylindrosporus]|uniref:Uncharacterized protein n=1 Tax=Streptomyces cylindrosporus TaxID=2927583 RepID=A0ABS9Y2K8_9ACTN|nr:hypothetical protein [Streptomyces cylindrosporus]MCI3271438.1 hypothetical protein [Streptomyces cylindrosporus]